MSKRPGKIKTPVISTATSAGKTRIPSSDLLPGILLLIYTGIEFLPGDRTADVMGNQWLYLSVLNLISLALIFLKKDLCGPSQLRYAWRNPISLVYGAFILIAGISVMAAINKTEWLVCFARLLNTGIMYFVILLLLLQRPFLFRWLAILLSLILLVQSIQVLSQFFTQRSEAESINSLIYGLKLNTGNKNILAAGLVFKIAACLYCVYTSRQLSGKVLFSLILFPASLSVFILNARAAYIGLILVVISFVIITFWIERSKRPLRTTALVTLMPLLTVVVAFLLSGPLIRSAMTESDLNTPYGTVTERLNSISLTAEGSNARILQWKAAAQYFKDHPFLGCGYGNWKLASIPFERSFVDDLLVAYHVHNDFLEMLAETGLPGGLLYVAVFGLILVSGIRSLTNKSKNQTGALAVFLVPALSAYVVDAFFNFPMERPVMQLFFALLVAVAVVLAYNDNARRAGSVSRSSVLFLLLLVLPIIYVTYQTSRSLIAQAMTNRDIMMEQPQTKWDDIKDAFPSIPNINSYTFPIVDLKAYYLMREKKYDSALVLLNKGASANPYLTLTEFLKAKIYFETNQRDSALKYARIAFEKKPRNKGNYELLSTMITQGKDSVELGKIFREYISFRKEPAAWNNYIVNLSTITSNREALRQLADSGLAIFPTDTMLLRTRNALTSPQVDTSFNKYFNEAMDAFSKKDFQEALQKFAKAGQIDPKQYLCFENMGLCYYSMGDYARAIQMFDKVIATGLSMDGKSEFFKGACLIATGKIPAACGFLQRANEKKYPEASRLLKTYCK